MCSQTWNKKQFKCQNALHGKIGNLLVPATNNFIVFQFPATQLLQILAHNMWHVQNLAHATTAQFSPWHVACAKFSPCHDSTAVVAWAKFCSNYFIMFCLKTNNNFYEIWILPQQFPVKCVPSPCNRILIVGGGLGWLYHSSTINEHLSTIWEPEWAATITGHRYAMKYLIQNAPNPKT